jgi:hypothetical protein
VFCASVGTVVGRLEGFMTVVELGSERLREKVTGTVNRSMIAVKEFTNLVFGW